MAISTTVLTFGESPNWQLAATAASDDDEFALICQEPAGYVIASAVPSQSVTGSSRRPSEEFVCKLTAGDKVYVRVVAKGVFRVSLMSNPA